MGYDDPEHLHTRRIRAALHLATGEPTAAHAAIEGVAHLYLFQGDTPNELATLVLEARIRHDQRDTAGARQLLEIVRVHYRRCGEYEQMAKLAGE